MLDYFHRVARETPTQFWINNPTPEEAAAALELGSIGATTNPTYTARMLKESRPVRELVARLSRETPTRADEIFAAAYREAIRTLQALFQPLYEKTAGRQGYVAIQGDPRRNDDADFIIAEALGYRQLGDNIIVKVPATRAGARALEELTARNIPTIATLGFSVDQALFMAETYQQAASRAGCHPVCYITYIAGILDEFLLKESQPRSNRPAPEAIRHAGCLGTRNAYALFRERGYAALLMGGGARGPQHFTELVGGALAITIGYELARQLAAAETAVISRIDAVVPPALVAELEQHSPTFRLASHAGVLSPSDFLSFGPVAAFQNVFLEGVAKVLKAVDEYRVKPGRPPGPAEANQ